MNALAAPLWMFLGIRAHLVAFRNAPRRRLCRHSRVPIRHFSSHRRTNSQTELCDNLLAWAVGSAPSGKARVLTGSLHALDTPFNIRVRRKVWGWIPSGLGLVEDFVHRSVRLRCYINASLNSGRNHATPATTTGLRGRPTSCNRLLEDQLSLSV